MISIFRQIIIGVTVAAVFSGVMLSFIKNSAIHQTTRIACGALMIIAVLSPLTSLSFDQISYKKVQLDTSAIEDQNNGLIMSTAKSKINKYISDLAIEEGVECYVQANIIDDQEKNMVIDSVNIEYYGNVTQSQLDNLSDEIEKNCGVAKDKQVFNRR